MRNRTVKARSATVPAIVSVNGVGWRRYNVRDRPAMQAGQYPSYLPLKKVIRPGHGRLSYTSKAGSST
jgi:hypothetical protein